MADQESAQGRPGDERDDYHLLEIANWEDMNVLPSCKKYQVAVRKSTPPHPPSKESY